MRIKFCLFIFLGLASVSGISQASPRAQEVVQSSSVPSSIRAKMPQGGRTWFFGKAPAQFSRVATYIHFYSIPTSRLDVPAESSEKYTQFNPRDYVLSLWQRTGAGKRVTFRRLQSITINGSEFLGEVLREKEADYIKARANVLWLRGTTRQAPIVRLNIELGNGVNASTASDDVLFVFGKGIQKPPYVQQFDNYFEMLEHKSHHYDAADEQGLLVITEEHGVQSGMDAPEAKTKIEFRWDGRKFVAPISDAPPVQ